MGIYCTHQVVINKIGTAVSAVCVYLCRWGGKYQISSNRSSNLEPVINFYLLYLYYYVGTPDSAE